MARFISELVDGSEVDGEFVLRSRDMRVTRKGDWYLSLELSDRTGTLPAVQFEPSSKSSAIPVGTVVKVLGRVTRFRGARRIAVQTLDPATAWDPADLVTTGPRSREELTQALSALVKSVKNRTLRRLLSAVFSDKEFFDVFCTCPASQSYHHPYIGGLLEHTVSVARICGDLGSQYEGVDLDMLVTAGLLHDIGKVDELSFTSGIRYTDEGRMIGHVVLTVMRVRDAGRRAGLDTKKLSRLEHALLSHHGELEWGSPKRPSTFEALLLHHVDNLDAKAAGFMEMTRTASRMDESWTDSANLFRRPLYAPCAAESDRCIQATEDEQHFTLSA
jgi:3'-5' exoribonuclease